MISAAQGELRLPSAGHQPHDTLKTAGPLNRLDHSLNSRGSKSLHIPHSSLCNRNHLVKGKVQIQLHYFGKSKTAPDLKLLK